MAHFAKIENGVVVDVLVVTNEDIGDLPFPESEPAGCAFLEAIFPGSEWRQTSYNGNFRKNYAVVGGVFDTDLDGFIGLKPYDNWILDEDTCKWVPPIPHPTDGKGYQWVQEANGWFVSRIPVTVIGA